MRPPKDRSLDGFLETLASSFLAPLPTDFVRLPLARVDMNLRFQGIDDLTLISKELEGTVNRSIRTCGELKSLLELNVSQENMDQQVSEYLDALSIERSASALDSPQSTPMTPDTLAAPSSPETFRFVKTPTRKNLNHIHNIFSLVEDGANEDRVLEQMHSFDGFDLLNHLPPQIAAKYASLVIRWLENRSRDHSNCRLAGLNASLVFLHLANILVSHRHGIFEEHLEVVFQFISAPSPSMDLVQTLVLGQNIRMLESLSRMIKLPPLVLDRLGNMSLLLCFETGSLVPVVMDLLKTLAREYSDHLLVLIDKILDCSQIHCNIDPVPRLVFALLEGCSKATGPDTANVTKEIVGHLAKFLFGNQREDLMAKLVLDLNLESQGSVEYIRLFCEYCLDQVNCQDIKSMFQMLEQMDVLCSLAHVQTTFHPLIWSVTVRYLAIMSDETPSVRVRVIKSLGKFAQFSDKFPSDLLGQIQDKLKSRLVDCSVQVRDAALDSVWKWLRASSDAGAVHQIVERLSDSGTSVRKRAIRIVAWLLQNESKLDRAVQLCYALVEKLLDPEPPVSLAAARTLQETFMGSEPMGVERAVSILSRIFVAVRHSFKVFRLWFGTLVLDIHREMVECILKALTESESLFCLTEFSPAKVSSKPEIKDTVLGYLCLLSLFSQWAPDLLHDHFGVLLRLLFLADKNHLDDLMVFHLVETLCSEIAVIPSISRDCVDRLERTLLGFLNKRSEKVVDVSVRLMSLLCQTTRSSILSSLWNKLYPTLTGPTSIPPPVLLRRLGILSLACRYGHLEDCGKKLLDVLQRVVDGKYEESVKEHAVHHMGHLIMMDASFISVDPLRRIYGHVLENGTSRSKLIVLKAILQAVSQVVEDGRSSLLSAQAWFRQVVSNSMVKDRKVQMSVLEILNHWVEDGVVHPSQVSPYYVAFGMLGTRVSEMPNLLNTTWTLMEERYGSIFFNRLAEGVVVAFEYFKDEYRVKKQRIIHENLLGLFFQAMGTKKSRKTTAFKSLSRLFDVDLGLTEELDLDFYRFAIEIIASLKLEPEDDPATLIRHIYGVFVPLANSTLERLHCSPSPRLGSIAVVVFWLDELLSLLTATYPTDKVYGQVPEDGCTRQNVELNLDMTILGQDIDFYVARLGMLLGDDALHQPTS